MAAISRRLRFPLAGDSGSPTRCSSNVGSTRGHDRFASLPSQHSAGRAGARLVRVRRRAAGRALARVALRGLPPHFASRPERELPGGEPRGVVVTRAGLGRAWPSSCWRWRARHGSRRPSARFVRRMVAWAGGTGDRVRGRATTCLLRRAPQATGLCSGYRFAQLSCVGARDAQPSPGVLRALCRRLGAGCVRGGSERCPSQDAARLVVPVHPLPLGIARDRTRPLTQRLRARVHVTLSSSGEGFRKRQEGSRTRRCR